MGPNFVVIMVISCLVLLVMFPRIFADSCENKVRLADLQDIIKNQTKLIREQKQVNQELSQVVKDQKNMIKKQAKGGRLKIRRLVSLYVT